VQGKRGWKTKRGPNQRSTVVVKGEKKGLCEPSARKVGRKKQVGKRHEKLKKSVVIEKKKRCTSDLSAVGVTFNGKKIGKKKTGEKGEGGSVKKRCEVNEKRNQIPPVGNLPT